MQDLAAAAEVNPNTMRGLWPSWKVRALCAPSAPADATLRRIQVIEQLQAAAAHDIAADFLEKMRSIGYTPEKAAALLEHWDTEEVEPHE